MKSKKLPKSNFGNFKSAGRRKSVPAFRKDYSPRSRRSARWQAAIVKSASLEEFRAVSQESWSTPMMKPTATTCMAVF